MSDELDLLRDLRALVMRTESLNPGHRPTSREWEKVFLAANRACVGAFAPIVASEVPKPMPTGVPGPGVSK